MAILCLTLSVAVGKRVIWPAQARVPVGQVRAGERISIPGVVLGSGEAVVLALKDGCPYCKASSPLYKKIVAMARRTNDRKVIAVVPEAADKAHSYVKSLGLDVEAVYEIPLNQIHVTGTPTLLVVRGDGVVKYAWYGQQPTEREPAIIREIDRVRHSNP